MEPSTTTPGRKGTLENPEVHEDVPGHVIPILQREFDDFDNEAEKYLAGDTAENEFIGFRLKQGVYGQRQADVQMVRVKLPFGGITPEQMDTFADVVEKYAPLNKAHITTRQNIQIHHVPLRDDGGADPRDLRRRALEPRGLRQHRAQRDRRPVGGRLPRRAVRPDAVRRRVRALLRAPPDDAADAAQGQDRVHRLGHRPRADRHPRHRVHRPRARRRQGLRDPRRRRHVDHAADRADADRLRARRRRRVPQVRRGGLPHLRPPGLAAREPRPCPHQGAGRQDRHRGDARAGRRGAAGRLGRRARLRLATTGCSCTTRRPTPRRRPADAGSPNGDGAEFRRFRDANVEAQRQEGFSAVQVHVPRGDLTPEQFRGLGQIMRDFSRRLRAHDRAPEPAAALGPRRGGLRRLARALRARPRRRRRRPDQRRRLVPRHRLLQARHHELDGAQPRGVASGSRRWGSPTR